VDYLSKDEVARFLLKAENRGRRDELVCRTLLFTGMRIGECTPLTAGDVNATQGTIRLNKVVTTPHALGTKETHGSKKRPAYNVKREICFLLERKDGSGLSGEKVFMTPAKASSFFGSGEVIHRGLKARHEERFVIPDRATLSMLGEWCEDRREDDFLWDSQKGGRLCNEHVYRTVRKTMLSADISPKKAHPHNLRHTFAVSFLKKTNDLARLSRLLGHSDIKTTTIYLRFVVDDLREAIDKAGDLFK